MKAPARQGAQSIGHGEERVEEGQDLERENSGFAQRETGDQAPAPKRPHSTRHPGRVSGKKPRVGAGNGDSVDAKKRVGEGYLLTFVKTTPEAFAYTEKVLACLSKEQAELKGFWRHVLECGAMPKYENRWVPVPWYLITYGPFGPSPLDLVDLGLMEMKPHSIADSLCREWRVPSRFHYEYHRITDETASNPRRVNLITGKATQKREKTKRKNDAGTPYDDRILDACDYIKYGLFNADRTMRWVRHARVLSEVATAKAEQAVGMGLEAASEAIRVARATASPLPFTAEAVEAVEEAQRLLGRYVVDSRALCSLFGKVLEDWGGGVYSYSPAFTPGGTGRISEKGGGIQNSTTEFKAAAMGELNNVHNYDLAASQPRQIRAEFRDAGLPEASQERARLILEGDKTAAAANVGIEVDGWKGARMAIITGGYLFESLGAARRPNGGYKGEIPRIISAHALIDPEAAYTRFTEYVGALYDDLEAWRKWLVKVWLPENVYRVNGTRYVKNQIGARFCVEDHNAFDLPRKLAAHILQGREAAFISALTVESRHHDYIVIANEHDGLVTIGEIPPEAIETARWASGMPYAELVEKPFKDVDALLALVETTPQDVQRAA